jgi:outer membrane protein TolC
MPGGTGLAVALAVPTAAIALTTALLAAAGPATPAEPAAELTLEAALAELDQRNPSLQQARARAAEASGLARQALAALLPQLLATGAQLHNSDEVKTPTLPIPGAPPSILIQPKDQLSVVATLRVPLLVPTAWFDVAATRDAARGAEAQAAAARLSLRAALAASAHLGLAAEEVVAAAERSLASARELAASADRRVKAGTAPPLDALRAGTEQVRREGDLLRGRTELERLWLAVGVLLGRDQPVRVTVPPEAPPAAETPADALVAEALAARPELRAQALQVSGTQAQVSSARARLAPQLSVSGTVFAADVPYPTGDRQGWKATLELTWPLYDGGFRYGKRSEAEARLASARAAEEAQRLSVSQETRDASREVAVAAERLRLATEQRRLAAEAAGSAQRSYREGIASSLDVVDSNDRLFAADVGLAEARARLAVAGVALQRALGRGP